MKISKITENEFRKMIAVSSNRLNNNAEFINSLNVFPVPDGDTGTNMSLSFASGAKYVSESTSSSVGELSQALAKGLLMGARGNSGVILSQVFRGFSKNAAAKAELTPADLAEAIVAGVQTAYKAVMKPQEGTILTVARKAAEAATKTAKTSDDCVEVMKAAYEAAEAALKTTPDLLPVLKEVGVVDSGGQGLTFVYQGFFDALSGNVRDEQEYHPTPAPADMDDMVSAEHHKSVQSQLNTEDIQYGYCTEIMVKLGAGRLVDEKFDYDTFRGYLSEIGNSLLVIADDEVVKVHVHTEQPGKVLSYGQKFGSLIKVKVDNMRLQHETILEQDKEAEEEQQAEINQIAGDYGIIAVASGDGLAQLFHSVGVTQIIQGGQTMNPSTKDIVDAINATGKDKVIVLPNNKNIFLAAEQAADVADANVKVVHTRSITQGLSAMINFNKEADIDENVAAMEEALDDVISGQVTIAVRDTTIDGQEIKKDNYMGIVDGSIKVTDPDRKKATLEMVKAMLDDDSEVITIIYGADADQAEAQAIADEIQSWDEDYEIEIHEGDQPVYPYLISVE